MEVKPKRKVTMPPPGKKPVGAMIAIGIGPKRPMDDPEDGRDTPTDKQDSDKLGDYPSGGDNESGKKPLDRAIIIRSHEHCINCEHYSPDTGECSVYEGEFDPQDACYSSFEPLKDEEPDEDDMGGASG